MPLAPGTKRREKDEAVISTRDTTGQERIGPAGQPRTGSRVRAVVVGLVAVAVLCGITLYCDLVLQGTWIAHNALPIGALALFLLLVTVGNRLARRLRPSAALTRSEVLLVYAMLSVAAGIPSVGLALPVLSVAVAPAYYHTAYHTAFETVAENTASWLRVTDPEAVRQYFHGLDPGAALPWRAWLAPLGAWSAFALLVYAVFLCMAVLLRRAWVEDERLTFPLVQVPVAIVGRDACPTGNRAFFGSPVAWVGMALPAILHSLNALHTYWPSIPAGFVSPIRLGEALVDRPWNALSDLRAFIYFSVIGLTYLLSSEVSLSLWFFFLLSRLEVLMFAALGFDDRTSTEAVGFSPSWFVTNQMWGALFFFGAVLLVDGLRSGWRELRRLERARDREGAATLRLAFGGLVGSLALLGLWLRAAGGQLPLQLGGLVLWMLAMLSLTRLVCAGGLLLIDTNYLPRDILYRVLGIGTVRPPDLAVLTYTNTVFAYFPQLTMLPFLFNAVKLGDEAELRPRQLFPALAAAILVAVPLSFALALPLVYHHGALTLSEFHLGKMARQNFSEMAGYLASPSTPQIHTPISLGVGAAVMAALIALRRKVLWWPFSPLGYLVGSSGTVMHHLWFCVLLGWLANGLVRRYGGLREFLRFRPFFLGLVLGEFLTAAVWLGIDALLNLYEQSSYIRGHNLFPGPG
jgi:hypothetical protein